ncbi:N-acetylmuramoyl-L-alanine amidase [Roseburia sp. BX1005]|uniref:N-acetylmuramoyl-L-alanine amidase n=1 Tax=Roseburia zhanii TaxID=2763064 RepID=A0A923LN29_9FIRM|nr:N-acetylmuramoyl-L-alanine amidase [Roseburia zhanii]MBC5713322.1 N-acetylmuramoyl-L-alanine amidase [Roseburia zhanii]
MKYILEKNGKREIVEKKKHSKNYYISAVLKWLFCIGILALTLLLCQFLDKKLNDGRIVNKIINSGLSVSSTEKTENTESIAVTEEATEQDVLTVCLDPGHGGMDPGCDYNGRIESEDNWALALAVKQEMESKGIEVIMTRNDNDTKVFLKDRVAIANASGADYFISLHRNKGEGYGIETWMTATNDTTVTETLTNNVHNALVGVGVQRDRGVKTGTETGEGSDYYVIGNTTMPACLLEFGFINNEEDNRLFDANKQAYAQAITQAVLDTYAQYGEADDTSVSGEAGTEDTSAADTLTGMTLSYPTIDNVSGLSGEILNWGQGSNVDEYNRPTGSLSYQEKYKDYPVDFIIPTTDKKIYLTFDEGYEYGCTPSILSTLKEKDVKAVFFVTKPYAEEDPDLVRQIIDEGHILGNHSVTHPSAGIPSLSLDDQKQEVMGNHEYIKQNFNYDMCLFRFPAGKFSEQSLAILNNCGYRGVFWSFAYLDYDVNNQPNEAESLQKLVDKLHPGAIYLLHAESWTNTNILGSFIDKAREAGYEFGIYTDTLK